MRPRRFRLWLPAVIVAVALLPLVAMPGLWPFGRTVEAQASLGGGWSWGDDASGQLGNGLANDGSSVNAPVQVGPTGAQLTNIAAVAGGANHSLALRSSGIVLAWGSDTAGQLGNGAANDGGTSNVPVSVSNLTNAVAIAAGQNHSVALRRDGTVWAWGNGASGQLGSGTNNSSNVPVQVVGVGGSGMLTSIIAVAAGGFHNLALRSNGTVVTWGDDTSGQLGNGIANNGSSSNVPVVVSGLANITAIAAGNAHSIALKRDSTVITWGNDNFGQLGNSSPFNGSFSDIPVQVSGLTNAIAVAAGANHSLALKSDGTVVAWGYDQFGQLGNGPTTDGVFSDVPVAVNNLANVTAIAGGTSYSLARKSDGTLVTWGRDNFGQLGNGITNDGSFSNVPIAVSTLANVVAIGAGGTFGLAVRSATNMRAWGDNTSGQFGNGGFAPEDCDPGAGVAPCTNTPLPVTTLSNVATVAAGELHSLALTSDGQVWAWGDDSYGQLGNGLGAPNSCTALFTPCALSPVPVSGLSNIAAIAAGDRHSIALRRDGTVWAWGSHVLSQLGNGGTAPDDCDGGPGVLPCATSPVQVSGLTNIVAIAAGGSHSLALRDNGSVYAWGNGTSGQLGNGANSTSNTPVLVGSLSTAIAIAAGGNHSLALKDDGTVVSWGSDSSGQLGNGGANANSNIITVVSSLTNVIALAGGGNHSLAVKDDGTVAAWGSDASGQLGDGTPPLDSSTWVPVSGVTNAVAVAAGANHSLALKSDGTVVAWGAATPALLGNGGAAPNTCGGAACALAPVTVSSLINIVAITAGTSHNLAVAHPADTTSTDSQAASATYGAASVSLSATVTNTTGSTPVGEGIVTFTVRDSLNAMVGTPLTSGTVTNGATSVAFPLVGVTAGTYSINITYSGSTNFLASADLSPASLVVNKAATSLTVSNATAIYGNSNVLMSATVQNTSNSAALTGGTVTFSVIGICTSSPIAITPGSSSATVNFSCPLGSVAASTYTINGSYSGDGNFQTSNGTATLSLNKANTTSTVVAVPLSVAYCNNSVTLTATVSSATGASVSEGTVNFTITGPGTLGPVNGIAVIGGTASTSLSLGTNPAGSYSISVTYVPRVTGPNFNGSSSSGGGNGSFAINPLNTTTVPDVLTAVYGATVPLHAKVSANPATACNVNAGSVTFVIKQGVTTIATVGPIAVNGTGDANATYSTLLPVGSYTIDASYGSTTNFNASTATSALTIQKAATTTTTTILTGAYGGSATLSATVSNASTSANLTGGTVTFVVSQALVTVCAPAAVAVPTTGPSATVTTTCPFGTAAPGSYTITATYNGDANFNTSDNTAATTTLTISKADTTTTITNTSVTYGSASVTLTAAVANTPNNAALTGGTVQFTVTQGATTVCTATSGTAVGADPKTVTASCGLNTPPRAGAGSYVIAAVYSGDANFNTSTATPGTLAISKANTTTAVNNAAATYGDNAVSISAVIGNSSNNVDLTGGTVLFTVKQASTTVCTATSGAVVGTDPTTVSITCALNGPPRLGAGTYSIEATYSGDANFNTSTDATPGTLTISPASSSITVANLSGPYGSTLVLGATVQTTNGVAFTGGSVTLSVVGVCAPSPVAVTPGTSSVSITANCPLGTLAPGAYVLNASYMGDANVTSSAATPGTATITTASTTTSVIDKNVGYGSGPVNLQATVQNSSSSANLTGGTVTFVVTQGVTTICSLAPVAVPTTASSATVSASCATGTAPVGDYSIAASYSGDTNFNASTDATPGTLTIGTTATTITVPAVSGTYGNASAALSATVQSGNTAVLTGGTVTINVTGGCTSGPLSITPGATTATVTFTCPLAGLPIGANAIVATYSGDTNFATSGGGGTLTINKANTSTSTAGLSAVYGSGSVQLSATVQNTSNSAALTGGSVTFTVTGVCSTTAPVLAGSSTTTINAACALGVAAPGSHAIVAVYSGDTNFSTSTSSPSVANLTITKATTSLQVDNVGVAAGVASVSLRATITNTSNSAALTGGTVTFNVPGVCAPVAVNVPTTGSSATVTATCTLSNPPVGTYNVTASYSGDTSFSGSNGSGTLAVGKQSSSIAVPNVSVFAEATQATLTATVTSADTNVALTGGMVTFNVPGVCAPVAVNVPTTGSSATVTATCTLSNPPVGTYTITATYSGDANFAGSSNTGTLAIGKRGTSVTVASVTVGIAATQANLSATVTSTDGAPLTGGTFTFSVPGICTSGALNIPTGASTAQVSFTCVLNGAAAGLYTIAGNYSGNANFAASSGTGTLNIDQPLVTLTITVSNGSVTVNNVVVSASTTKQYPPGTVVTAIPQAQAGFTFIGWAWDSKDAGWANPVTLTMNANHALVAKFASTPSFSDVPANQPYTTAVIQLAARGLIRGYGNGAYGPNDTTQRAQMAALIARAMPSTNPPGHTLTPPNCLVPNSWDCEDWGNTFNDRGGTDASLWRNVGTLAHYGVALGYGNGSFGPSDEVSYAQTISFITRAMVAKGYWAAQPNESIPYLNVPSAHLADVRTFYFYTKATAFGGVPDGPTAGNAGFGDWNGPSTRGWFARTLWAAVNSYFSIDQSSQGGYIP